jgi:sulfatase maturation enzyme AslB (radical SAM superfamily)
MGLPFICIVDAANNQSANLCQREIDGASPRPAGRYLASSGNNLAEVAMHVPVSEDFSSAPIDFAWLELTNRCNLQCSHCYTESSPTSGERDLLSHAQYVDLIHQLYLLGCRKIQFIGGEPTLNKGIPKLIDTAKDCGYDFVEVFTNLVSLPESLLNKFVERNIAVATSFYSHDRKVHDRITRQIGSFDKTVRNIRRVLAAGLTLRAGVITMDENVDQVESTWDYLEELGVTRIGTDHIRKFGRARDEAACSMGELCGSCAGNILSIGPDGVVAPCNMSKQWAVGSVLERTLSDIVFSDELRAVRQQIGDAVDAGKDSGIQAICDPKTCSPYNACCPSTQSCNPCAPNGCSPCFPKG